MYRRRKRDSVAPNEKGKARTPSLQSTGLAARGPGVPHPSPRNDRTVLRHLCVRRCTPGEKRSGLECANTTSLRKSAKLVVNLTLTPQTRARLLLNQLPGMDAAPPVPHNKKGAANCVNPGQVCPASARRGSGQSHETFSDPRILRVLGRQTRRRSSTGARRSST